MNKTRIFLCLSFFMIFLVACNKNVPSTQVKSQTPPLQNASSISSIEAQESSNATPVTTPHFSLILPEDWAVLYGPVKERGTTRFQLIDKAKTSTVSITVGPSQAGDAEEMARRIATRLQTRSEMKNGQWQCSFTHEKSSGYTIVREDTTNSLLMVLTVSGDIQKADFVFKMRSPYVMLLPQKP